jgi:DNA replication protein DnaC
MASATPTPTTTLTAHLQRLGLPYTAETLNDLIARATQKRWSPLVELETLVQAELDERARRRLERRLRAARLGRFKPLADFEWDCPSSSTGPRLTAPSPWTLSPRVRTSSSSGTKVSARRCSPRTSCISRRYEQRSIILTTNLVFKDWNTVFPNASRAAALIDRLTHHAEIIRMGKARATDTAKPNSRRRNAGQPPNPWHRRPPVDPRCPIPAFLPERRQAV